MSDELLEETTKPSEYEAKENCQLDTPSARVENSTFNGSTVVAESVDVDTLNMEVNKPTSKLWVGG
jgi:hypothetical protein